MACDENNFQRTRYALVWKISELFSIWLTPVTVRFGSCSVQISARRLAILNIFHSFPQPFQANARTVPEIRLHQFALINFLMCWSLIADLSGRMVYDLNCLHQLEHRHRGFESHSRHGCLYAFILCLCCPVYVVAFRWTDLPSKESYRLFTD
jgi:hypothetical protein